MTVLNFVLTDQSLKELGKFPEKLDQLLADGRARLATFYYEKNPIAISLEEETWIINAEFPLVEGTFKAAADKHTNFTLGELDPTTKNLVKSTVIELIEDVKDEVVEISE
nr:hypothetical protein [uncultured Dyadobacter sp.]